MGTGLHERPGRSGDGLMLGVAAVLQGAVFLLDIAVPQGAALQVAYAPVVALAARTSHRMQIWGAAIASSALTLAGLALGPGEIAVQIVANRAMSLLAIWVVALVCLERRRSAELGEELSRERATEQRLARETAQIVDSISAVLIGVGADGRVTRWNAAAEEALGLPASTVLGRPFAACGIRWCTERFDTWLAGYDGRSVARLDDLCFRGAGEERRLLSMTVNPLQRDGTPEGLLVLARDVTELNEIEETCQRARKLESVGQLAAGLAHEINTPIQYVSDNVRFLQDAFGRLRSLLEAHELLLESARAAGAEAACIGAVERVRREQDVGWLWEEIPQALDQSLAGAAQVGAIVRAMKEFSLTGGEDFAEVDINRAIESTIAVARNEWKHVAQVVTDLDPGLPPLACHAAELNQVVLNLIQNAAHAIAEKRSEGAEALGTITLRTRCDAEWAEIHVIDDGTGIPDDIVPRIFDPFFTTKGVGRGTGQGLAIAYAVVRRRHGGTIEVKSEVGVGSTFVIRLPLRRSAEGREQAA